MPAFYTGKLGTKRSQLNRIVPARPANTGVRGFLMNALLFRTYGYGFAMNALIWSNTQTRFYRMNAVVTPASGITTTVSADDETTLVEIGVYQGGSTVKTQKVYRWEPWRGDYRLVHESSRPTFTYTDIAAPVSVEFWYRVIGYDVNGGVVSTTDLNPVTINSGDWWLVVSDNPAKNLKMLVGSAPWERTRQTETFQPVGSEFRILQAGDLLGRKGSIEIILTKEQRGQAERLLREMANSPSQVYLKTPYGESLPVDIGSMTTEIVPGGGMAINVPYVENN